jgi:hypothetical protein
VLTFLFCGVIVVLTFLCCVLVVVSINILQSKMYIDFYSTIKKNYSN